MTANECDRLKPGDIIMRNNSRRTLRLVIANGRCVALAKIGHSWTDPNPGAWYDAWAIREQFVTTGKRAPGALRQIPLYFKAKSGVVSRSGRAR